MFLNLKSKRTFEEYIRYALAKSIPFRLRKLISVSIYRHLYFSGLFNLRYKTGKKIGLFFHSGTIIENEIYWRGLGRGHEPLSMTLWIKIIKKIQPKVIIDIGANTGIYGVVAKLINNSSAVHFFEPTPAALFAINKSLEANKVTQDSYIHNVFLSDRNEGLKTLFMNSDLDFSYVYYNKAESANEKPVTTSVWTLSAYFQLVHPEMNAESIELVKIDVEGHEFRVLSGFKNYFSSNTIFLIEVLNDQAALELQYFFTSEDYIFLNIDDDSFSLSQQTELKPSIKWNILIVPKSKFSNLRDTIFNEIYS